jgi:hypothetical protein
MTIRLLAKYPYKWPLIDVFWRRGRIRIPTMADSILSIHFSSKSTGEPTWQQRMDYLASRRDTHPTLTPRCDYLEGNGLHHRKIGNGPRFLLFAICRQLLPPM